MDALHFDFGLIGHRANEFAVKYSYLISEGYYFTFRNYTDLFGGTGTELITNNEAAFIEVSKNSLIYP